jgi:hypothetical protein
VLVLEVFIWHRGGGSGAWSWAKILSTLALHSPYLPTSTMSCTSHRLWPPLSSPEANHSSLSPPSA